VNRIITPNEFGIVTKRIATPLASLTLQTSWVVWL